jgi:transposase
MTLREKQLQKLQKTLTKKRLSARQIATSMGCSMPTVYRWIAVLRERGALVGEVIHDAGRTGPRPRVFTLLGPMR